MVGLDFLEVGVGFEFAAEGDHRESRGGVLRGASASAG